MASVKIIPAMPHAGKTGSSVREKPRLRVAAYCRVSTDTEEQASSYATQVEHYTEYISRNRNGLWRASTPMTAFPAPIPKTAPSSTA